MAALIAALAQTGPDDSIARETIHGILAGQVWTVGGAASHCCSVGACPSELQSWNVPGMSVRLCPSLRVRSVGSLHSATADDDNPPLPFAYRFG